MSTALATTALLMGLVGGGHCVAMCGPLCGALAGGAAGGGGGMAVLHGPAGRAAAPWRRMAALQAGRLAGYMGAGAAAAGAMQSLAWLSDHAAALRPAWTLVHFAALCWGLLLLLQARQPAWVERLGRRLWQRVGPLVRSLGRLGLAGLGWAAMPCGLLYSALLAAALAGGPADGALAMLCFGLGTAVWLAGGPWLWLRLRIGGPRRFTAAAGVRLAGAALCAVSAWAVWADLQHRIALWC
ncbi:sulfite exporter TauE/SafE family protein [Xylophilus sp.]|uniref:sulfite exporter TauE/SafE family protein n=1 Tax=Xylophilus sp. TaxID=2653893 RepID=UPI0013B968FE|nr:sulfite exporter TauE/SafE family protein [Xylophilus sp.]KAF1049210.1 MAG: hypothetical protein GAK38_00978 [Xylophilus sp.]